MGSALRHHRRLAGAALLCGSLSIGAGAAAPQPPDGPRMVRVTVEVELSCPSCAAGLERRMLRLDHVAGVDVRVPAGQVVLAVDPGGYLDLHAVWDTVRNAGFLPDRLAVTALGHVAAVNDTPVLALSPDYVLPLAEAGGLTDLATEAGDELLHVTGHWTGPPDGAGQLVVESFELVAR